MNSYESYKTISNIASPLSNTMDSKYISKKFEDIFKKNIKKNIKKNEYIGIRNIKKYFQNKNVKYNLEIIKYQ